jgi:hypothetical protein
VTDDLQREGEELQERLRVLEAEQQRLHGLPHDHEGHVRHVENLLIYKEDVRRYQARLAAARRARGIPDPELF